jgi:hypothetical protein
MIRYKKQVDEKYKGNWYIFFIKWRKQQHNVVILTIKERGVSKRRLYLPSADSPKGVILS